MAAVESNSKPSLKLNTAPVLVKFQTNTLHARAGIAYDQDIHQNQARAGIAYDQDIHQNHARAGIAYDQDIHQNLLRPLHVWTSNNQQKLQEIYIKDRPKHINIISTTATRAKPYEFHGIFYLFCMEILMQKQSLYKKHIPVFQATQTTDIRRHFRGNSTSQTITATRAKPYEFHGNFCCFSMEIFGSIYQNFMEFSIISYHPWIADNQDTALSFFTTNLSLKADILDGLSCTFCGSKHC
eukprot:670425_1